MSWRTSWARNWDDVKYCSAACRSRRVTAEDLRLEQVIIELLDSLPRGATISPDDAARRVGADANADADALREPARRAARRLVEAGDVEIVQHGRVVDPSTARGLFAIRRSR